MGNEIGLMRCRYCDNPLASDEGEFCSDAHRDAFYELEAAVPEEEVSAPELFAEPAPPVPTALEKLRRIFNLRSRFRPPASSPPRSPMPMG